MQPRCCRYRSGMTMVLSATPPTGLWMLTVEFDTRNEQPLSFSMTSAVLYACLKPNENIERRFLRLVKLA